MKTNIYILMISISFALTGCLGDQKGSGKNVSENSDSLLVENIFPFQLQHCHGSTIVELPNKDLLVAWFQGS